MPGCSATQTPEATSEVAIAASRSHLQMSENQWKNTLIVTACTNLSSDVYRAFSLLYIENTGTRLCAVASRDLSQSKHNIWFNIQSQVLVSLPVWALLHVRYPQAWAEHLFTNGVVDKSLHDILENVKPLICSRRRDNHWVFWTWLAGSALAPTEERSAY